LPRLKAKFFFRGTRATPQIPRLDRWEHPPAALHVFGRCSPSTAVPKGTAGVADALQKLIDDKSSDGAQASTAAEQVVYRLRAR
jgi:hypothetical protein